jgi:hypothetical protein
LHRKEVVVKKVAALSVLAFLGAAIAVNAPPAAATDISLESRTYVPARGTDGENTHVLLYEYLTFNAEDLVQPGLYLRVGGWGRTDLADETFGQKTNSELQYAFLGWRAPQLNAEARVGRLALTAGVARNEVFDGILLGSDLPAGFDITLFGGIPVETDTDGRSSDTLYGARISQGRAGLYRLGASYLKEENAGSPSREETGADIFLAPLPLVALTGSSLYNTIAKEWARHDYRLALGPFVQRVRLAATWASTDYRYYFQSPVHPAFLPEDPTADETLDRIGGEVEVELGRGFTLAGEYTSYTYDIAGAAKAYGGGLAWAGKGITAGGDYRQVDGDEAENRYKEISAYASVPFGPLFASANAEYLTYEEEINGEKNAMTGKLGLTYPASRSLELAASVEYGKTPEYDREVKGFFAVTWRYDASMKKGGTK